MSLTVCERGPVSMAEPMIRRDPPANTRQPGYVMEEEAAFLREHPGESYIVRDYPPEEANAARMMGVGIRQGRYRAFQPSGSYGARTATEPNEKGELVVNVYAWYGPLREDDDR